MVAFHFNVWGYSFQSGLDVLARSYVIANEALGDAVSRAEDDAIGYQQAIDQGLTTPHIERDEEGRIEYDHEAVLHYEIDVAADARMALRKSFAIAAYHQWERGAHKWCNDVEAGVGTLTKKTLAEGYPIDPKLTAVHHLVSLLKHSKAAWAKKLQVSWPELIPADFHGAGDGVDWYEVIQMTDAQFWEALNAIARSGPTPNGKEPRLLTGALLD